MSSRSGTIVRLVFPWLTRARIPHLLLPIVTLIPPQNPKTVDRDVSFSLWPRCDHIRETRPAQTHEPFRAPITNVVPTYRHPAGWWRVSWGRSSSA
ncbi:hypothetical protein BDP81DRAFT_25270 [Colletotrichum phormii]|uniref:Uncharacterized protein n=1 Tax=Colletotrichum phormii TaxID=359342 RepID=A0AAI9ZTY3_9PEZI|nr:uncharacterized protein BDP81DRAFT_25270 [Colletotrichum phormii]KAK1636602.1 hypothetical protein BDP81DRAFT_25270 [Colletotrichum phormii]